MFSASARTQYAIRAMTNLARRPNRTATAAELARTESIPAKYLEGIMARLKVTGLVESERGKNGGYRMATDPANISMLQIVEAIEGRIKPVGCLEHEYTCAIVDGCHPRSFWLGLKNTIDTYLSEKSLKEVSEG